jgi:hypothetical protein
MKAKNVNPLFDGVVNVVRAWIITELEFIGKDECARVLERYWKERQTRDLAEILKFAQFPEPLVYDI